jgi:uncharacterized protein (TIGR03435 family)
MTRAFAIAGLLLSWVTAAFSQASSNQPTEKPPAFTAAEIHASKPGTTDGGSGFMPTGQFFARGETLLGLISNAYGVENEMVSGGPAWLDLDRFDISTKAPVGTPEDTGRLMLQAMLAERFKLAIHREERPLPVYALAVGKRGAKLKDSEGDGTLNCKGDGGGPGTTLFTLTCQHATMKFLAQQVRGMGFLDRPVVDLTGLTGAYDITMTLTLPGQRRRATSSDADQPKDVSVFEAVDKLGLKLEAQKQPVSVIVVDHINQTPTDNPTSMTTSKPKATEFEVSDVRVSKPGANGNRRILPSGRIELNSETLRFMLRFALNFDDDRIIGAPKWIDTDKFDVIAQPAAATDVNPETLPLMLKALLVDRFKLATHEEEQSIPIYGLVVAKRGLKLKEADGSVRGSCKDSASEGRKIFTCQNTTMTVLADKLRNEAPAYIDHAVLDLTELKGAYDFSLSWTPRGQFMAGARGGDSNQPGAVAAAADPNGDLSVFEAIEKQLGLKLELQKHTMPVVVIDHLERTPTEN